MSILLLLEVSTTEKLQVSKKTVDTSRSNKIDTVKIIDKSRSTQITDTFNTIDKSRFIPVTNLSNRSTIIEKPTEIDIVKYNKDISGFFRQEDYLVGITSDILCITCEKKRKFQALRLLYKDLLENQSTLGKGKKRIR